MRPKIGFKRIHTDTWKHVNSKPVKLYAKWDGQPMRQPKKGEYFISGTSGFECAYKAKHDMTTSYYIATLCEI